MKPNEITISAYLSIEGEQWPIHLKAEIEATDYVALARHTSDMVSKLKKAGFQTYQHKTPRETALQPANGPNEKLPAAFAWPAPVCPVCKVDMKVSKFQELPNEISYYCVNTVDMGVYCKRRASVNRETGQLRLPEVKE